MYDLKTKAIPCPNCNQLVKPQSRYCPHCQADLAVAAVIAEKVLATTPLYPHKAPLSPEMLVPRLGEHLVKQGVLVESDLERALAVQAERSRVGDHVLIGQLLVEMGFVSQETLDLAVTQHVFQLQAALKRSNQQLEQRVQERTAQLQNALVKLSELNQLKANFIANVSHELRMPLQFVIGYIDLLATGSLGPLTEQQAEAVDSIQNSGLRLKYLIEELLHFSDTVTSKLPLQIAPISLAKPVETAVTHSQEKAQARQIKLATDIPASVPQVNADDEKITWVIEQFLDNAIKFTPPGGKVRVQTKPLAKDVRIAVTDTGIGFPMERLEEVFEPFHQLDGSSTRHYGGTGLGLALARSIVEAHGSTINVRSQVGHGSYFAFSLPAVI